MSNVVFKMSAYSNISYNREVETGISVDEWAQMSDHEKVEMMQQELWEDIDISAVNEDTGEYL